MTTIISGTNRPHSRTLAVALHILQTLKDHGKPAQLLDLAQLPEGWFHDGMYTAQDPVLGWRELQQRYINGAERFIFLTPEYNGGYAGVLKLFIDAISVYRYRENFSGKWSALIGVSTGRSGGLRGLDQLSNSLQHMGGLVLPFKLPLSKIDTLLNEDHQLVDAVALQSIEKLLQEFFNN